MTSRSAAVLFPTAGSGASVARPAVVRCEPRPAKVRLRRNANAFSASERGGPNVSKAYQVLVSTDSLQAFGWYLSFLLFGALLGGVAGIIFAPAATSFSEGFQNGFQVGWWFNIVYLTPLATALLWSRRKSALNVFLALAAVLLGLLFAGLGVGRPRCCSHWVSAPRKRSCAARPIRTASCQRCRAPPMTGGRRRPASCRAAAPAAVAAAV